MIRGVTLLLVFVIQFQYLYSSEDPGCQPCEAGYYSEKDTGNLCST